ncbi:hypothetical protein [Collimonas antrihumi]|uniref:hypothetical protein n=1 Tax=Collimonas antrihumi TaxID=1940615 RepID=UPI001B8C3067|nr:hypothetical protein [Collimonas antrihumi]
MKSPSLLLATAAIAAAAALLAGCVAQPTARSYIPPPRSSVPAPPPVSLSESLSPSEQIVDMPQQPSSRKSGELSDTVERMARRNACTPAGSATLIAKTTAAETYQVSCQDGQQQLYKCELRQCRQMN